MQVRNRLLTALTALCAFALVACGDEPDAFATATVAAATATITPAAMVAAATVVPTVAVAPAVTTAPTAPAAPTPTVAVTAAPTRTPGMASATPATGATGSTATARPASSITAAFGPAPVSGTPAAPVGTGTGPNATIGAISTSAANANQTVTVIAGRAPTVVSGGTAVGTAAPVAPRTPTPASVAAIGGPSASGTPRATVAATPRATATTRATSTPRTANAVVAIAMAGERYQDARGRFSFEVPQGWEPGPASGAGIVVRYDSSEPLGLFNITSENLPAGITLDQYIQISVDKLRMQAPDATFAGDPSGLMLGGEPAKMLRYEATLSGSRLAVMQVAVIRDRTAYVLTFGTLPISADDYFPSGDVVLTSWRFM